MHLKIDIKPFSFQLNQTLKTSKGELNTKKGWLLRIKNPRGEYGWGEVSPFDQSELEECGELLKSLKSETSRQTLETGIAIWPGPLAFGIGAALAEIDGLIGSVKKGGWLQAPPSAILLPSSKSLFSSIDLLIKQQKPTNCPLTLKWKIAIESKNKEKELLSQILKHLPKNARLRLDANSGLDRIEAKEWGKHFLEEPRLEWLEQPLAPNDLDGLYELGKQIPVALDESLLIKPSLRTSWKGWQVRRPLLEGDPRILLKELEGGVGYRMLSTSFETGIGLRWINHLAALQHQGPTPTAPGLAPGWCPNSLLFSSDPKSVWEAA